MHANAKPILDVGDAAVHEAADVQLSRNLRQGVVPVPISPDPGPRSNNERFNQAQFVDQLGREGLREVAQIPLFAEIIEVEHGYTVGIQQLDVRTAAGVRTC